MRLTRDQVLVCVHDRRVQRTSNGCGAVSTLELADLHELDFASWKPPAPRRSDGEDTDLGEAGRVLTLERLLQLVLNAGRPVQLHIETKHPTRYRGQVERALLDLLTRYGLTAPADRAASRVCILSYSLTSLRRVHAAAPRLPTVLNTNLVLPWLRGGRLPRGVSTVGVALRALRAEPGLVERVHARRGRVHVFTWMSRPTWTTSPSSGWTPSSATTPAGSCAGWPDIERVALRVGHDHVLARCSARASLHSVSGARPALSWSPRRAVGSKAERPDDRPIQGGLVQQRTLPWSRPAWLMAVRRSHGVSAAATWPPAAG